MNTAIIKPQWGPLTIALMVLGFVVWFPLGLAMLAYILWGEMFGGSAEKAEAWAQKSKAWCRDESFNHKHNGWSRHSSGNAAFDDYRAEQLKRLEEEREGLLAKSEETKPSAGPGSGGGIGTGQGTGLGQGDGSGIGDGSGGGTGGGPYRPGSGVDPPRLLKEVRALYSDQARRANLEGVVDLEIVIRRDGSVGDVRVMKGLGLGLNEQAIQAVRQWRFAPARLKGAPVDVIVEVSVEFRLR